MATSNHPKVFISYSWSNADHERWVLEIAESLVQAGVKVLFDKWDLREGQDTNHFMEKMVNDATVSKVVILADRLYVEKANDRSGGVGTETQIISAEIYAKQDQTRFVLVVCERDENGKPFLPTYYKSRIYIDLSSESVYASEHEKLIRWIYDKPLYVRPEIGVRPGYLDEGEHLNLGTGIHARRALDAIMNGKPTAQGAFKDYANVFQTNLERFRIARKKDMVFDEVFKKSIDDFLPFKNEALSIFSAIAAYSQNLQYADDIHFFLEIVYKYTQRPGHISQHYESDFDNFRFIVHELFLSIFAIFIKSGRFDLAGELVNRPYYLPNSAHFQKEPMMDFSAFLENIRSFDERKRRLESDRISLHADELVARVAASNLSPDDIYQADIVLFLRAQIKGGFWYPETCIYVGRRMRPLEIFARSISRAYFEKIRHLLGVADLAELKAKIGSLANSHSKLGAGFHTVDIAAVTGTSLLGSQS
ncbi:MULTISPECIES: toll/interleukin-1 receptor domain-containing protein [unclassified Variovorax]|uniref:toll/interleukin-1 receptor domain-containing protein n=1 Tax=unclassified Variovorax TaxID=663243 RepID=UPI0032E6D580